MTAIAAIHTGLRQLRIEGDDKRDLYRRVTGLTTLTEMRPADLESVVTELRRLGFKPSSNAMRKRLEGKFAPKLQALWIAGWNLGLVRDKSDAALVSFVKRQTRVDHIRFLHHGDDANRAIEGLKAWLARQGGVSWDRPAKADPRWMKAEGYRIVCAQLAILTAAGRMEAHQSLPAWFAANAARLPALPPNISTFEAADWRRLMNHLGELVRKIKTGAA